MYVQFTSCVYGEKTQRSIQDLVIFAKFLRIAFFIEHLWWSFLFTISYQSFFGVFSGYRKIPVVWYGQASHLFNRLDQLNKTTIAHVEIFLNNDMCAFVLRPCCSPLVGVRLGLFALKRGRLTMLIWKIGYPSYYFTSWRKSALTQKPSACIPKDFYQYGMVEKGLWGA